MRQKVLFHYWGSSSHYCYPELWRVQRKFFQHGIPKKTKNDLPTKKIKHKPYPRRPWIGTIKYISKRKHRALERELISKEKYDRLGANTHKHLGEDPWYWD